MQSRSRLVPVGEEEAPQLVAAEPPPAPSRIDDSATWMLMTALKALSQRAMVALAAIEHLLMAGSVFALWLVVISQPTQFQLVALGMYGIFILALIKIRCGRA